MPFTVQDLLEEKREPVVTHPAESAQLALQLMLSHDFSQLPVLDETNRPRWVITQTSILRALSHFSCSLEKLRVIDAMEKAEVFLIDGDLFELLDRMASSFAVVVVDAKERLQGVITNSDTTAYFRRQAEDFMLIGDVESMLREYIQQAFTGPEGQDEAALRARIIQVTKHRKGEQSFEDLTLSEYISLFRGCQEHYPEIFGDNDKAIIRLLYEVRDLRNAIAHFHGGITEEQRDRLRFCVNWLARHRDLRLDDVSPSPVPEEGRETPPEDAVRPGESRYAPLAVHLQKQPLSVDDLVMTFEQLEAIIGAELPPSARRHRAWWNNHAGNTQGRAWLDVGWQRSI